ncbi:hypothetical protein WICPIJ_005482 [Wickerhamomyces pijperi]|uniref:Uncharacterized protein n=1 Tax=Wickerhamomyces pijperi TaxID=599730 RepID=A0A9P8TLY1_WICPI|nr:hypothetical protein WICPIJ_005482 [Wickerhamomyces pijperi]
MKLLVVSASWVLLIGDCGTVSNNELNSVDPDVETVALSMNGDFSNSGSCELAEKPNLLDNLLENLPKTGSIGFKSNLLMLLVVASISLDFTKPASKSLSFLATS